MKNKSVNRYAENISKKNPIELDAYTKDEISESPHGHGKSKSDLEF